MRLTLGKLKTSIARVLNVCSTDMVTIADYVNRAQERLMNKGKYVGTYGRYRVCARDSCLTWPRELLTIEAFALNGFPGTVRDEWYEFLESGPGVMGQSSDGGMGLIDRGQAVAFDDVRGTSKKLAVYCDGAEAAGSRILVQYYDANGQKRRTVDGSNVIEGEYVTLPAPGNYNYSATSVMAGGLYAVIKPVTLYNVRLYEHDMITGDRRPLAYYEPDEEIPNYRRSLIPGLGGSCTSSDVATCNRVEIVGKRAHRPVVNENDFLIIEHGDALRLMVQAIDKEEKNIWDEAERFEAKAQRLLEEQVAAWRGSGVVTPIRMVGSDLYGGGIENVQ
jgi:hypothetical protein